MATSLASALPAPFRSRIVGAAAAVVLSAGCHDSPADPLSGPTTVETVPSLSLAAPLPDLPELVAGTAPTPEIRAAVERWRGSWDAGSGEADREAARRAVAGHLAGSLDARGVEEALRSLLWAEVEVSELGPLPPELAVPLEDARLLTARAAEARRDGRLQDALEAGLAAADQYRSVTPEVVARRLVARGRALLAAATPADDDPGASNRDVSVTKRARHLLDGAARALAAGDHLVAVQRAFYGIQVLEGRMTEAPVSDSIEPGSGGTGDAEGSLPGERPASGG